MQNKLPNIVLLFLCVIVFTIPNKSNCQENTNLEKAVENNRTLRIMFYNCENFFDIENDSLKKDDEFLPNGEKHWTKSKYYDKQNKVCKVITAVGGWDAPEVVGLCEIENRKVLNNLTQNSPLYKSEYKIIHKESPDVRGIDVAMLYRSNSFTPIHSEFIPVHFPDTNIKTRDILYCAGKTKGNDTVHIFVNHFPSRWGGQLETENKRTLVAGLLRKKVDSIFTHSPKANIVILGDFNDYPKNKSMANVLDAKLNNSNISCNNLYNLTYIKYNNSQIGTHKYDGKWDILDQIIVSGNLLKSSSSIHTNVNNVYIYNAPFLLEPDNAFLGTKTFRTYVGYRFNGGFSDHLPVFIDLNN